MKDAFLESLIVYLLHLQLNTPGNIKNVMNTLSNMQYLNFSYDAAFGAKLLLWRRAQNEELCLILQFQNKQSIFNISHTNGEFWVYQRINDMRFNLSIKVRV